MDSRKVDATVLKSAFALDVKMVSMMAYALVVKMVSMTAYALVVKMAPTTEPEMEFQTVCLLAS